MRRTSYRRKPAALIAAALAATFACSPKTLPYAGGLMLSVQTDLAAPKDVAAVGLFITSDGRPIFSDTRDVAPNGEVRFPATIAILGDEARPRAQIKIRVVAFKDDGNVRILRDILTTVPKGRTGLLRAPLLWINEGSGKGSRSQIVSGLSTRDTTGTPDGFTKITSACPEGQTFLEGECGDATVDGESLPDYQEKDVFGGGNAKGEGGRCFDVRACFGGSARVDVDSATCSASLGGVSPDDPNLSFAVQLPASAATGECRADGCLVPLDKGTGWKTGGAGVTFPKAVCARIASGAALGILRTTACPTKDAATPACGPASIVSASSAPPGLDGGAPPPDGGTTTSQDFENPIDFNGEPGLSSVALDANNVFVARTQANPPPSGVVRLARADIESSKNPPSIQVLTSYASPQESAILAGERGGTTAVLVRNPGDVRLCKATSANDCPTFPLLGDPRLVALGDQEAYAYGNDGGTLRLVAIPYANPSLQPRVEITGAKPVSMTYAGGKMFFGTMDQSITQCTLPCADMASYSQILAPPPNPNAIVAALATDTRVKDVLFVLRAPLSPADAAAAGVFAVKLPSGPEAALVAGADVTPTGGPPPSGTLAVDSEYVYFGGSFVDPRDGLRKNGLLRKRIDAAPQASAEPFLEPVQGTTDIVTAIAVDANAVYWTYGRPDDALVFAKKKRSF